MDSLLNTIEQGPIWYCCSCCCIYSGRPAPCTLCEHTPCEQDDCFCYTIELVESDDQQITVQVITRTSQLPERGPGWALARQFSQNAQRLGTEGAAVELDGESGYTPINFALEEALAEAIDTDIRDCETTPPLVYSPQSPAASVNSEEQPIMPEAEEQLSSGFQSPTVLVWDDDLVDPMDISFIDGALA